MGAGVIPEDLGEGYEEAEDAEDAEEEAAQVIKVIKVIHPTPFDDHLYRTDEFSCTSVQRVPAQLWTKVRVNG